MKILKFSTSSCGQCRVVSNMLEKAGIEFEEVDCVGFQGALRADEYNIRHVPVIVVTEDDGKEVKRYDNLPSIMSAIKTFNNILS